MNTNLNRVAAVIFALTTVASAEDDRPIEIQWNTLAPAEGDQYRDPFAKLTRQQLQSLSFVVRIQRLIAAEKISPDGDSAAEAEKIAGQLKKEDIDIPWLMAQRDRVRDLREQQARAMAKAVVKNFKDKSVSLTGFVLPLKITEGRVTDFYLVSSIAACSHASAPPENQVVFVESRQGIVLRDRNTGVKVTGKIRAIPTTQMISRLGRVVRIEGAYSITPDQIEGLKH